MHGSISLQSDIRDVDLFLSDVSNSYHVLACNVSYMGFQLIFL